jgi:hypothetical protein
MNRRAVWKAAVAAAAVGIACAILILRSRGAQYKERAFTADSEAAQATLDVLRRLAADPAGAPALMSADAGKRARAAVSAIAAQMRDASSVDFKNGAWFGGYLRVTVTCRAADGTAVDRSFFLKDEGGALRITGPAP